MPTPTIEDLRRRVGALMMRDQHRLGRRLHGARRTNDRQSGLLDALEREIAAAELRVAQRRARVPRISYPPELPVSARKDDILGAIRENQVVVVAGETGSGKTTQIPKICLEIGRGVLGTIGHTQPRRIAARAVADRIAEELGATDAIGYKVRFTDRAGERALVKVMTDGILLAEIQRDRMLLAYDTVIIDEAHERSLNVDFLVGYLKRLLPERPDLKVIITSATIDPARFARHFDDAPVIEVSGRTYPVEVFYLPIGEESDQTQAICDAVDELTPLDGDVLVFLSGEREIRDTADALRRVHLRDTEILPLYARLSAAEQHRVFAAHPGRRVVLATNVAETSLTVPGIRYVIDPGTARISRYSNRTKVQRLPIEPVSQASANQRKGRCGRVADGICIRLYSEDDFRSRPDFTDPEILRTNLAAVILQMAALRLGDVADFPFLDPPDRRQVRDGVQLLEELGALTDQRLTDVGRRLAQLPIDPRIGRMLLEADGLGCVNEVLVIAAALSIQDPRERPADAQETADAAHARFRDPASDFLGYLNLWTYLQEQQDAMSSSAFRRLCRAEFLSYLRVREWQDLEAQLAETLKGLGIVRNSVPAEPDDIHRALLAGLLSHIGLRTENRDYLGARGVRFAVFPGSGLSRKPPLWMMAAELVETSRLWARINARIEPEWVEPISDHLVSRTYSEPHWEKNRGSAVAYEKVLLYGVPIVAARRVAYGRIDPAGSRDLFIRHALVEGDWRTHQTFWHENRRTLAEIEELEHRTRRRDVVVDDETLYALYDERIPADVVSQQHFDRWWKQERRLRPDLLTFTVGQLMAENVATAHGADYPQTWPQGDLELTLSYRFEPGAPDDGVTATIPLAVLNQVDAEDFAWQVPGLREELAAALIRSLPKALRRQVVPAPDHARWALARMRPHAEPFLPALARELHTATGVSIHPRDWDWEKVPAHLRITFRVVDGDRRLATGKDLAELRAELTPAVRETVQAATRDVEITGLTDWPPLEEIPRMHDDGVLGYPALVDEVTSVALRVLDAPLAQRVAHRAGVRRLLRLSTPSPVRSVVAGLDNATRMTLGRSPYPSAAALLDDALAATVDSLVEEAGGAPWTAPAYKHVREHVRAHSNQRLREVVVTAAEVLSLAHEAERLLSATSAVSLLPSLADARDHLSRLVRAGFISATGWPRLIDVARYTRGISLRLDRLPGREARDRQLMATAHQLEAEWQQLAEDAPLWAPPDAELANVRWMLEELRVSLFAQILGTPYPVSDRRVLKALDALTV
ncbi:MAG: ATP-dependent RNA helicase HrpA [Candidatus Nanopelagicales bacterium]